MIFFNLITSPSTWLFEVSGFSKTKTDINSTENSSSDRDEQWYLCRSCGHRITPLSAMIIVAGSNDHTFCNPKGLVFNIGCFSSAHGCRNHGRPTSEHSWFAGHSWRYSDCASCSNHLGWHFSDGNNSMFWGLILSRLFEEQWHLPDNSRPWCRLGFWCWNPLDPDDIIYLSNQLNSTCDL